MILVEFNCPVFIGNEPEEYFGLRVFNDKDEFYLKQREYLNQVYEYNQIENEYLSDNIHKKIILHFTIDDQEVIVRQLTDLRYAFNIISSNTRVIRSLMQNQIRKGYFPF